MYDSIYSQYPILTHVFINKIFGIVVCMLGPTVVKNAYFPFIDLLL